MLEEWQSNSIMSAAVQAANTQERASSYAQEVELERLRPFYLLKPAVYKDGNQWCALYGENIAIGVCAFGDTPAKAATNFDIVWLNGDAKNPPAD